LLKKTESVCFGDPVFRRSKRGWKVSNTNQGEKKILLDYGIKINGKTEYPMQVGSVDMAILSHAHLDHSGFFPTLFFGTYPTTIMTEPTAQLSELLIKDSMKINRRRHAKQNFFKKQLNMLMSKYIKYEYGVPIENNGYYITLYDAIT